MFQAENRYEGENRYEHETIQKVKGHMVKDKAEKGIQDPEFLALLITLRDWVYPEDKESFLDFHVVMNGLETGWRQWGDQREGWYSC